MKARQLFLVADMGKCYWITNFTIRGPLKEIRKQLHDWWRCFFYFWSTKLITSSVSIRARHLLHHNNQIITSHVFTKYSLPHKRLISLSANKSLRDRHVGWLMAVIFTKHFLPVSRLTPHWPASFGKTLSLSLFLSANIKKISFSSLPLSMPPRSVSLVTVRERASSGASLSVKLYVFLSLNLGLWLLIPFRLLRKSRNRKKVLIFYGENGIEAINLGIYPSYSFSAYRDSLTWHLNRDQYSIFYLYL